MAATAATACVWSGVLTTTASICRCNSSSILRKSTYRLACGNFLWVSSARRSSTSHSATRFSPDTLLVFEPPCPQAPMMAMRSFSLAM